MEETTEVKRRNIISPWRSVGEFCDVAQWIYGENADVSSWKRALRELRVWINRRRSQCPAAVYATHALLEVSVTDEANNQQKIDSDELRTLYAYALVRFFNFMSSTIQTHNMRSMYTTAIELGLESFVVDIRHICAHGTELPELCILRKTADYCLNWLHGYYWRKQSEKMMDANGSCLKKRTDKTLQRCAKEFGHLCGVYDIALQCYLTRCETLKDCKQQLRGRQLVTFREFWKTKNLKCVRDAFDLIIMDMVAIFKSGVSRKHLTAIFAREFMKMKSFFAAAETHSHGVEVEQLIDVVQNLFRFLAVYNVIEIVLQRLFETAESTSEVSDTVRLGASFWARHIVDGFAIFIRCRKMFSVTYDEDLSRRFDYTALNFGEFSKNVRETYIYSGVNVKRSIIFGDSFQRPWVWHFNRTYLKKRIRAVNSYTAPILPSLWALVKPKMNDDGIARLQQLTEIYLSKNIQNETSENRQDIAAENKIYTLEDVLGNCREDVKSKQSHETATTTGDQIDSENIGGWRNVKYDEFDWSKCPIGHLPWH